MRGGLKIVSDTDSVQNGGTVQDYRCQCCRSISSVTLWATENTYEVYYANRKGTFDSFVDKKKKH